MKRLVLLGLCLLALSGMEVTAQEKVMENINVVELLKGEIHETNWNDKGEDTTIQVSYEDAQALMKIATAEGGTEGVEGMLRIMQVVWNRVLSPDYPDSITEVIEQHSGNSYQFATVKKGTYYKAVPTLEAHLALAEFEKNERHDSSLFAFETVNNGRSLLLYFDYYYDFGNHTFYKNKKN